MNSIIVSGCSFTQSGGTWPYQINQINSSVEKTNQGDQRALKALKKPRRGELALKSPEKS